MKCLSNLYRAKMSIWKKEFTLDALTEISKHSLAGHFSIEFTDFSDNSLSARMPVERRTQQPFGYLHGGASCVLAETVASVAGNLCIAEERGHCVGIEINCNHIKAVDSGYVHAKTWPHHIGKSTQVWQIEIRNDESNLVAVARLTLGHIFK